MLLVGQVLKGKSDLFLIILGRNMNTKMQLHPAFALNRVLSARMYTRLLLLCIVACWCGALAFIPGPIPTRQTVSRVGQDLSTYAKGGKGKRGRDDEERRTPAQPPVASEPTSMEVAQEEEEEGEERQQVVLTEDTAATFQEDEDSEDDYDPAFVAEQKMLRENIDFERRTGSCTACSSDSANPALASAAWSVACRYDAVLTLICVGVQPIRGRSRVTGTSSRACLCPARSRSPRCRPHPTTHPMRLPQIVVIESLPLPGSR